MIKHNYKLTLFVGDTSESVSIAALNKNSAAFLIDQSNIAAFKAATLQQDTTVYTSLGDLPKDLNEFVNLCLMSDEIVYCPQDQWSDCKTLNEFDPTACIQGLTESLLIEVSIFVPVIGLNIKPTVIPVPLVDSRKTAHPQLWIAGCSVSHGVGVTRQQRYGHILSNKLQMECSFLTRPGSAIDWASDQIIRSDIKSKDLVIFGVTNAQRLTYVHEQKLVRGITSTTYKDLPDLNKILPEFHLVTENTFYQHVMAIERVINFCNKVGANLVLVGLLTHGSPNMLRFLTTKPNFVQYPYKITPGDRLEFVDLGNDNNHPGPMQHLRYADFILQQLHKKEIIGSTDIII